MRKLIWTLVVLIVVAVFGTRGWYLYTQKQQENKILKIGVLTVLSGPVAQSGVEALNGAILAAEKLNLSADRKVKLLVEDGKAVAKDAVSAFNKLLLSKVDAAIVVGDVQIAPVFPLINERALPTVATGMGSVGFLDQNIKRHVIHISPSNYECSYAVGQYAKENLALERVAVLQMKSIFGDEGAKGFIKGYGEPIIAESFKMDELDMRVPVLKVLDVKPDGIYITGFGASYVSAIKRLREYGFDGVILSEPAIINNISMFNPTELAKGVIFADTKDLKDNSNFLEFYNMYKKRFGEEPTSLSTQGYDAVQLLYNASQDETHSLNDALAATKEVNTYLGKLHVKSNGKAVFKLVIKQMQPDGTAKVVKE